jgi:1A family penicillin-binding protein
MSQQPNGEVSSPVTSTAPDAVRSGTMDEPAVTVGDDPPPSRGDAWRHRYRTWRAGPWPRRLVLSTLYASALTIAGFFTTASWWWSCGWEGCPTPKQLQAWRPTEGGALYARDSAFVSALSPVRRVNMPLARVPLHVQKAFIAVEDRRFLQHDGVDWHGVARAVVANLRAGGVREGASTISMQLARNVFLGNRAAERTLGRKLLEWRFATLLEEALTKEEILERYLNAIYLGNGVYGVEAASRDLFGKSVESVTLAEAALLAGLPKAPSSYTPRRDRARAVARRNVVLEVLAREGVADREDIERARTTPVTVARKEFTPTRTVDSWAVEATRVVLDSLRAEGIIPAALNDAQLRVWTTIDHRAQLAAERAVAAGAAQVDKERENGGFHTRGNRTQGALVAIDPATGAVRAIVGGRRIERKGFNRALRAQRQPGSTFKPFVYAAAIAQGFTPASMVMDSPVEIPTGRTVWRPANYGDSYNGRITLRDALNRSANAATVRVSRDVGIERIASLARAHGITSNLPLVPALALGAAAITPLELTAAYAPFANGGDRVQPHLVLRVQDPFGQTLWEAPPASRRAVLDATDAFLVTSLLQSVVDRGTGRPVRDAGIVGPVAGKTGTTNDGTDVWFVGYSPTLVASVWLGADTPQPLGWNASGGRLAAPVWARFMRDGWHSPAVDSGWATPAGIEEKWIDVTTGKLASSWCGPSRKEFFKLGTAPTQSCEEDQIWAMRDDIDWHNGGSPSDLGALIGAAVNGDARGRLRRFTDQVMRQLRRLDDGGRRGNDNERPR